MIEVGVNGDEDMTDTDYTAFSICHGDVSVLS